MNWDSLTFNVKLRDLSRPKTIENAHFPRGKHALRRYEKENSGEDKGKKGVRKGKKGGIIAYGGKVPR
jgi:hypothetical protein